MKFWFILLVCGSALATPHLQVVEGYVIAKLPGVGFYPLPNAKVTISSSATNAVKISDGTDGTYGKGVNIPRLHIYDTTESVYGYGYVYVPGYGYEYGYGYYDQTVQHTEDNILTLTANAGNYYPVSYQVNLNQDSGFLYDQNLDYRTDIGLVFANFFLEPIVIPVRTPGNCKVEDNLWKSNGQGACVDQNTGLSWGANAPVKKNFKAAVQWCANFHARLPNIYEIQAMSRGNGWMTHFNFDATPVYWSSTVSKQHASEYYASPLVTLTPSQVKPTDQLQVVCVI